MSDKPQMINDIMNKQKQNAVNEQLNALNKNSKKMSQLPAKSSPKHKVFQNKKELSLSKDSLKSPIKYR